MRRLLLIPLAILLLLIAAMVWSGTAVESPADFTFVNRGDIGTLDPNRMSWLTDIRLGNALWEGLYALDPKTLQPIPGAADGYTLSSDKTIYTFHIRPDARWSDGSRVESGDFVFAWRRMLEEPGDYTELFHCIKGAQAYEAAFAAEKPADFKTVGIIAPDSTTLRVELNHPVTYFLDLCAFPPFFPLNARSMAAFKQADPSNGHVSYDKAFTRPPYLVSNGPFRLALWQFKRRIRLEASPYYWDRQHVRSNVIDVLSTDDPMWGYLKYDSGAVDWIPDASGSIAAELYARHRPDLHVFPAFGSYFYSINCDRTLPNGQANPFADVRVRRAFSLAVDRRPIVETITRLGERPAFNYIPPGIFPDYPSPQVQGYDVKEARRLLAEAGYPGGRGFPSVSILFNTEFHHAEVAQIIRRQWLEQLGVEVKLEGLEVKIFRQRLHHHDFTIARASWFGDYNDPSTFADKYLSDSGNNDSDWKNSEYDRLCEEAAVESDNGKRMRLLSQAEALLLKEQPIIPLYYYVNCTLFRSNVVGISLNPRNMVLLKWVGVREGH
jgi:oligopeptide transport system substrate-binding protein